jgi:predicted nucleic acid-binding protein
LIVLDASVLIAQLNHRDAHHQRASALLAKTGNQALGASPITLAESLVSPARSGRLADMAAALNRLGVDELPLPEGAPTRLAQLRAETGRKLPDCCILLAAEECGATVASFDDALLAAATEMGLETLDR